MPKLFPPIQPNFSDLLAVGQGHQLYYEEVGNPDGLPVVVVHGGPGSGSAHYSRQFFNPEHFRVILFDQRGCGRSTPYACLADNQLPYLIQDMEQLRQHLDIPAWVIFGGSWGTTLALAYAKAHPESALALVCRAVFLARPQDIDWLYGGRTAPLHPKAWQAFSERGLGLTGLALLEHYDRELNGSNEIQANAAARAWVNYEYGLSALERPLSANLPKSEQSGTLAMARISARYMCHGCYLDEPLLSGLEALSHIPMHIIHGRYDLVCPVEQALALKQTCPWAQLDIIQLAGHSGQDPQISSALVRASYRVHEQLR